MKLLAALLLLPGLAFAQTTSTTSMDSIVGMKATLLPSTVTLLTGTPGAYTDVGVAQPITGTPLFPTIVTIVSPIAATINGVRANICGKGNPWRVCAPFEIDISPVVVTIPGSTVKLVYNDAFGLALSGSSATLVASVTPPAVVAPPAPPVCTPDPIGTKMPPAAKLIAADCSSWVLTGTTVTRNGVSTNNPFNNPGQTAYIQVGPLGPIRVYRPDGVWNCWNGSGWVGSGC